MDNIGIGEVIALSKVFGGGGGGSSGGGVLVVHQDDNGVLDKTWQEIHDAGFTVLADYPDGNFSLAPMIGIFGGDGAYGVAYAGYFADESTWITTMFIASSASGYPAYVENDG